jgi:PIN domain nuclease of toxin-antitoxin system
VERRLRLLLDTHALLWTLVEPNRLSARAAAAIAAEDNEVFVSIVSPWEMAIAKARGRMDPPDDLEIQLEQRRFKFLPVTLRHTRMIESLPHHHRDPFDRMLIAQAQVEGLTIVTVDRLLRSYPISLLSAA